MPRISAPGGLVFVQEGSLGEGWAHPQHAHDGGDDVKEADDSIRKCGDEIGKAAHTFDCQLVPIDAKVLGMDASLLLGGQAGTEVPFQIKRLGVLGGRLRCRRRSLFEISRTTPALHAARP